MGCIVNSYKIQFYILFSALLILGACDYETTEYPNVKTDQIGSYLKWNLDYASIEKILTEDFNLEFSKEIEQGEKNKLGKVFEYKGGKLNDVDTEFWKVVFENDSLLFINISIATENPEETKQALDKLTGSFLPDTIKYPNEERWFIQTNGKRLSEIQIMRYPDNKGIFLTFFRPFEKFAE
ncbi:MAG: hypothetical protein KGZ85_06030 [Ignavibacterium sp.]|nr:hypothetical protein [Ignavibacterium sp.]